MKIPFLTGTEQCWWWVCFYTLFPIWQECVTHYQGKAEINDKGITSISEIKSIIRMLLYTWLQNRKTAIPTLVLIEKIIISNTWHCFLTVQTPWILSKMLCCTLYFQLPSCQDILDETIFLVFEILHQKALNDFTNVKQNNNNYYYCKNVLTRGTEILFDFMKNVSSLIWFNCQAVSKVEKIWEGNLSKNL